MKKIRNFSIIAHIDHGKSTLSDRIIQICSNSIHPKTKIGSRILDSMDLERERGITIKAQNVSLNYQSIDGEVYQLNLIDTPGHVDFSYEVSRSLAACEGALLVIDAVQGVEAQTLANYFSAIEADLTVVFILNKVDLPTANPDRVEREIKEIIGIDTSNAIRCSAKTGIGLRDVLERLVRDIPPPTGEMYAPLQALIIDSWFDKYLGVVFLVRIKNGTIRKGDLIKVMSNEKTCRAERLGVFTPKQVEKNELKCGEVGWLVCGIKEVLGAPVGDTLTNAKNPAESPLFGFKKAKPQVYAGLFPVNSEEYVFFRDAIKKLSLNDSSLFYEPENSSSLGFGFRCGFLGPLHMEIVQERLEREYNLDLIITAPTVVYEVQTTNKEVIYVDNPSKLPPINSINELREPIAECRMLLPKECCSSIMTLCVEKRGIQTNMVYYGSQVSLTYDIPMAEIVTDFFYQLQSFTHGYASLDYNFKYFQSSQIEKIDVLINGKYIDALAVITHNYHALRRGRELVKKMKDLIPRQQFDISIQAIIRNHVIARSTVKQLRKNVIARCYGGDVSRKKKLLQKQKEGKKRMKRFGNIQLPKAAFLAISSIKKDRKQPSH